MRKLIIFVSSVFIFMVFSLFLTFSVSLFDFMEFNRNYESTYTSAVCIENVCMDYIFKCKNGEITNSLPISGFVVFEDNWVDEREIDNKC